MKYDDELHQSIETEEWTKADDADEIRKMLIKAAKNTVSKGY